VIGDTDLDLSLRVPILSKRNNPFTSDRKTRRGVQLDALVDSGGDPADRDFVKLNKLHPYATLRESD
jgi:hypothetical protein